MKPLTKLATRVLILLAIAASASAEKPCVFKQCGIVMQEGQLSYQCFDVKTLPDQMECPTDTDTDMKKTMVDWWNFI